MKKVIIGFLAFFLIAGTAYAAGSTNIVKVLVNGKPVQDGQLIDGSTMLPLRAIGEALGVTVDWDNTKKQASITTPQKAAQGLTLEQLNAIGDSVGLVYTYDGTGKLLGTGSGFVTNGLFITNAHVLEGGSVIEVWFGNEKETINVSAAAFRDEDADLAGFAYSGVPSLELSVIDSAEDDTVYALSFPHRRFTITEGFVVYPDTDNIIHTAKTDPGSSGGILINVKGKVIGVITGGSETSEINDAVPAKILQDELNKL